MRNVIVVRHGFSGFVKVFGLLRYSESNSLPVSIGNTYKGQLDGSSPIGSAILPFRHLTTSFPCSLVTTH